MIEPGFVLVDSNVIIDIVQQDERWVAWSMEALSEYDAAFVNPIIFAELCYQYTTPDEVDDVLKSLSLLYQELPREALYLASQAFRLYRKSRGTKTSPLPDFFIGAHAAALGVPIITRDVSRYQTYFPSVPLICP
jgi:predicted nucleic acid-binding protein